jgi:hypothetical protein
MPTSHFDVACQKNHPLLSLAKIKLPSFGLSAPLPGFSQDISAPSFLCLPKFIPSSGGELAHRQLIFKEHHRKS